MPTYFVNTDAVSNSGCSLHDDWIRRGIAVTGGDKKFRIALEKVCRGDTVLMYVNGVGLVARGVAVDDSVEDVFGDAVLNAAEPVEYHKRVRWNLDLRTRPITPAALRQVLGQTPIQAVQRVLKGESALARQLALLAAEPTADSSDYVQLAEQLLLHGQISRPEGSLAPARVETSSMQYFRDPRVRAWSLQRAAGRCELCDMEAPFRTDAGSPYLESHHVTPLAEGGNDTPINTAAVCANCHRELHSGEDRMVKREKLRLSVAAKETALRELHAEPANMIVGLSSELSCRKTVLSP